MDARRKGGKILPNALAALLSDGVRTPEQHARYVFETQDTYDSAIKALGSTPIVNPVYYVSYPHMTVDIVDHIYKQNKHILQIYFLRPAHVYIHLSHHR